jgi:hypothetical protein
MQLRQITIRYQYPREAFFRQPAATLVASVSMLGFVLTPMAVMAGALGAWRFGVDLGWTRNFFITDGVLSRYESWFAAAIVAQTLASILNGWASNQKTDQPALARQETSL